MVMKKKSKTTAMKEQVELSCSINKDLRKRTRTIVVHLDDDNTLEDLNIEPAYATVDQVTLQRFVGETVLTFHITEEDERDPEDDDDDFDESEKDEDEELDDHLSEALDDDNEDGEL